MKFQTYFCYFLRQINTWEQRKLSDLADVCSGRDYKHLSEGTIPVYGTGGYMLSVSEALSYDRDAIGIGRKGTIDKPYVLKAPFWTVDTLFYAVPKHPECLDFIHDIFQIIDWKKKDESTGVPSLSKEAINDTDVMVPKTDEQLIIGSVFARIDNLITLHQREPSNLSVLLHTLKSSVSHKSLDENLYATFVSLYSPLFYATQKAEPRSAPLSGYLCINTCLK